MNVYAAIRLYDAADAASKLDFSFNRQGNNLSPSESVTRGGEYGADAFLLKSGAAANTLGLFNIMGSDGGTGWRFGTTDAEGEAVGAECRGYPLADGDLVLTVRAAEAGRRMYGVIIRGDAEAGQYPVAARYRTAAHTADGQTEYGEYRTVRNGNAVMAVKFAEPAEEVQITFDYWSRPGYNACVNSVEPLPAEYVLPRSHVTSMESRSQLCDSGDEIAYGALPGDGELELYDSDGELAEMMQYGIIPSENAEVSFYTGETLVQRHLVMDSDYDGDSKTLKFTLGDLLSLYGDRQYAGMMIDRDKTLWDALVHVLGTDGFSEEEVASMCGADMYAYMGGNPMSVEVWLKCVKIPLLYLESSTMREALDKICEAGQLYCYCAADGRLRFVSARPQIFGRNRIIRIPRAHTYGASKKSVFPKLKYSAVETSVNHLSLTKGEKIASYDADFYENNDGAVTSLTSWQTSCDAGTAREFTYGDDKIVYFEKTLDVSMLTRFENLVIEVTDKRLTDYAKNEYSDTYVSNSDNANTIFKYIKQEDKQSFMNTYINTDGTLKENYPYSKRLILGYYTLAGKCVLIAFVKITNTSTEDVEYTLNHKYEVIADQYEVSENTLFYEAA